MKKLVLLTFMTLLILASCKRQEVVTTNPFFSEYDTPFEVPPFDLIDTSHDIPAFENVANLEQLPVTGAWVIALPMKIEGGSGGPVMIVALVGD